MINSCMFATLIGPALLISWYFESISITNYFYHNLVDNFCIKKYWVSKIKLSNNNRKAMLFLSPSFTFISKIAFCGKSEIFDHSKIFVSIQQQLFSLSGLTPLLIHLYQWSRVKKISITIVSQLVNSQDQVWQSGLVVW